MSALGWVLLFNFIVTAIVGAAVIATDKKAAWRRLK